MAGCYWHHLQFIDKLESDEDEEVGKLECESDEDEEVFKLESDEDEEVGKLESESDEDEEVDKLESDEDEEVGKLESESDEDEEVDKLESDEDEEEVSCWLCGKSVLGSRGYKSGECTNFFIHESCPETTDCKREIEAKHNLRSRHHLISTKEVEKNGDEKKVVVCSLCDEPPSLLGNGPTFYKCFFPNCTFLIHQPCAQLPYYRPKHPLHFPNHGLRLKAPNETQYCCGACGKVFSRCFFYKCYRCNYKLHVRCASLWRNISADNCNPHSFISTQDLIEFTCQVCGVNRIEIAYLCSNCRLLIHSKCVRFLGTIKIRGHGHSLICTFFHSQVKKHKCEVGYENVDTKYVAYCCNDQKCDYIVHLRCAYWFRIVSETSDSIDYTTHLVKGNDLKDDEKATLQEIEYSSHPQHKLIFKLKMKSS